MVSGIIKLRLNVQLNYGQVLSRTKLGASKLAEIRIIIANDGSCSAEDIAEFVKDCETLRHKTKQAIRSNSPHSILQGLQQRGNDQTQPCAFLFRDSDGIVAFMFASIQYNRHYVKIAKR